MVTFLICVLALSTITFAPMTARAEGGILAEVVDCSGGFAPNRSPKIEVTSEEQTYVFTSTTNSDATFNWNSPVFFVGNSEDDTELFAGRSDAAAWVGTANTWTEPGLPDGYSYQSSFNLPFENWESWLAANKAGVECKITMQQVENTVKVTLYNNGITSIATIPASGSTYVTLSGELCKLTNIRPEGTEIPDPDEPGTEEPDPGTEEPDPGTEEPDPGTDKPDPDVPGTEDSETLTGTEWWTGNMTGSNKTMSGDGTWTWEIQASALVEGYGAFNVEIIDPAVNGFITTGSDKNAWTAEGFDPAKAVVSGVPAGAEQGSDLVEGHTYAVTVTRSGNTFTIRYSDRTADQGICKLVVTPGETVSKDVQIHVIAQVGTYVTTFSKEADTPEPDEPGTDEPGTEEPGGVFLDCPGWWVAHTEGMEITEEPHTYKFNSKTYKNADANWNTPVFVVFSSEDRLVKEAGTAGYTEYGVIRSDHYHWGDSISETSVVFPEGFDADWDASWAAWQAANRAGVECTVTTQLYKDYALVGVSNNGVTTTYAIRINPDVKNYLSLTGELCTLSDLQTSDKHIDLSAAKAGADAGIMPNNNSNPPSAPAAPAAPASEVRAVEGGEVLVGSAWWTGMAIGSNQPMSGDGTWTWVIQASALADGYGAFSVEIYDPATNGYITTGSDMNAWTAEGFNPASAVVSGVPAELASNLVEGHTYVVTVNRSGNTFMIQYVDYTEGTVICTLSVTPGEPVSNDVMVHVMAQVGTYSTSFVEGALTDLPASKARAAVGEVLTGTAWWTGMTTGSNKPMSGDGTWTWTVKASSLMDGYGAFSVEIYDPATNGYITTGSDMNAWTAEGFDPAKATVSGVPANLASNLVEGHTYAVTVTRSGNTFTVRYSDHTTGKEICTLVITPGETVGKDVLIHVMAQVGTFATAFNAGTLIAALGDSAPIALYVLIVIGLGAIGFGFKKRFAR